MQRLSDFEVGQKTAHMYTAKLIFKLVRQKVNGLSDFVGSWINEFKLLPSFV